MSASRLPHYFELLLYKSYADLRAESARTYIGFVWWFIDPIVNMVLFYFVFSFLLDRGVENYVPFLLVGMVVWKWFNSSVIVAANSIRANAGLINQVYIPKAFFPLVVVLETSVKFAIAFALLLAFLWAYGFPASVHYAALPVVMAAQAAVIVSLALLLSSVVPFFPDLNIVLENVLRMLFFLSGVFFPTERLPESIRSWFVLNPMLTLIESFRDVLMYQRWPSWSGLLGVLVASLVLASVGFSILGRYDRVYPRSTR
ncbi:MAG: ABC transporter permease [Myxococcota bacterium]